MSELFRKYYLINGEKANCTFSEQEISEGISLYEVIRIIQSVPLFVEDHYARLINSARLASVKINFSPEDLTNQITFLCRLNRVKHGNVKLIVHFNKQSAESLLYFIQHAYPSKSDYQKGVPVDLYSGERKNPNAKIIDAELRNNINRFIKQHKLYEALLVNHQGNITEGSRSNFFAISQNICYTAPLSDVLPGITRKYVFEACRHEKIKLIEKAIHQNELCKFDAAFICGTSPKVLPVKNIGKLSFNPQNVCMQAIMGRYNQMLNEYIQIHL